MVMWYDKLTTFIIPSSNGKQPHACNNALKTSSYVRTSKTVNSRVKNLGFGDERS